MAVVLLKNRASTENILHQQDAILKYCLLNNIRIKSTEIENSDPDMELENRREFRAFLRSLQKESALLVYDLFTLSYRVDELVKIFECILSRSITLHICKTQNAVSIKDNALHVVEILSKQREVNLNKINLPLGRPKGRMSTSKFDMYRDKIISFLEKDSSISEISRMLNLPRSSLKDYIYSRGLKELANTKKMLLNSPNKTVSRIQIKKEQKECSLISEQNL